MYQSKVRTKITRSHPITLFCLNLTATLTPTFATHAGTSCLRVRAERKCNSTTARPSSNNVALFAPAIVNNRRTCVHAMDQMKTGWFSEVNDFWAGQCMSLKVDEVLHSEKSEYQDILVLKTTNHGRVLILDGIIQCTERDEFVYQEMITFLPLCAHPHPKKVLIVGGGDGGVAREVVKHPQVETVVQVEIDAKVVEISKKYLPFMSSGFSSPKLTLIIGDGFRYMREHSDEFDVIITDSSDPIGPAVNLFTESYFELLRKALRGDGVICSQAGNVWYDLLGIALNSSQTSTFSGPPNTLHSRS